MRRLSALAFVALLVVAGVLATGAGGSTPVRRYHAVFDTAFGLTKGSDVKVAGVRAGQIADIDLEPRTNRALVELEIRELDFGGLRASATCEVRQQSLIGEYYVDCDPGSAPAPLPDGATIPVTRTHSTVSADLVNNILRRPHRERLSLFISALGAGVAGNAANLQATLRRASPALRETERTLHTLADQNAILADLARDGDRVVSDLAANRRDVGRFVDTAAQTATASAERHDEIAAGFRRLPAFLAELRPAMAQLGRVADEQGPALEVLSSSADRLTTLFDRLGTFADVSRPAFGALGKAAVTGTGAARRARISVAQLERFSRGAPELSKNLRFILEHLDDRDNAIEPDVRSPGGKGYTGLEALLQYVQDQTLATNTFTSNAHLLKATLFASDCSAFTDSEGAKADPELFNRCATWFGPNHIGINFVDPTDPQTKADRRRKAARRRKSAPKRAASAPGLTAPAEPAAPTAAPPRPTPTPGAQPPPLLGDLEDLLPPIPPIGPARVGRIALLDYLLAP